MSKTGKNEQNDQPSAVEMDILNTAANMQLEIMDDIETQLDVLDGSLNMALEAHKASPQAGFYVGLSDQVQRIGALLDKLRSS